MCESWVAIPGFEVACAVAEVITNCMSSSVDGRYPFVTCHIFPSASHSAGEVKSNVEELKLSIPGLFVFVTRDAPDCFAEDIFAFTGTNDDIELES